MGNFSGVINAYLDSEQFKEKRPSTQYNYRRALDFADQALGFLDVEIIDVEHVQNYLDVLRKSPGKQWIAKTAIAVVSSWGRKRGLLRRPIVERGMDIVRDHKGHKPWTDAQIELAEANCSPMMSRAITLAANTGQRGSDIITMRWSEVKYRDGIQGIEVVQLKTGRYLFVPFNSHLKKKIAGWKKESFFLINDPATGRAFNTRNRLSHLWTIERSTNQHLAEHRDSDLHLHGLRASAVIRYRGDGATELEIESFVGMSPDVVRLYCRYADQNSLATKAFHRLYGSKAFSQKAEGNQ